jgi:hypothetical protein
MVLGRALMSSERAQIDSVLARFEYVIPVAAMPITVGIEYVHFLVELVVNHHKFAVGAPVVGGRAKIGKITYVGGKFEILD